MSKSQIESIDDGKRMESQNSLAKIKNLKVNLEQMILNAGKIVIVPHNGVDYDALASSIGFSLLAKKFKKDSCIIIDDPVYKIDYMVQSIIDEVKEQHHIMNKEKYLQIKDPGDLFILTDVNKSNLISLSEEIKRSDKVAILDHHNEDSLTVPSDCKCIEPNVSSASEMMVRLLCLYKIKITKEVAQYLLAGIYLDTKKKKKNVSADTMKAVTKLLENGADMNRVTDLFVEDFKSDRRVQDLVGKAQIDIYTVATILSSEEDEYTKEELAKAADYLLKYNVDASFVIGNIGDGTISVSARSKEKVNVGSVMQQLGGGGNQFSAATKLQNTSIEQVGSSLQKIIKPACYIN